MEKKPAQGKIQRSEKTGTRSLFTPVLAIMILSAIAVGLIYLTFFSSISPIDFIFNRGNIEYGKKLRLAETYYLAGKFDKAMPLLEDLAKKRPGDTDVRVKLGVSYAKLGYTQKAEMELQEVIRKDSRNDEAFANLAAIYLTYSNDNAKANNPSEALRFLDLAEKSLAPALKLDPSNINYRVLKKQIADNRAKLNK